MGIVISVTYLRGAPYVLVSTVLKYLLFVSLGAVKLYERAHIGNIKFLAWLHE